MTLRPDNADVPVNEAVTVTLNGGQEAVITFSPAQQQTTHTVVSLAVSKHSGTTYEIEMDGTTVYGPAAIPPTDIDDLVQTFVPPREFNQKCRIRVSNTSASAQTYHVQLLGYEEAGGNS